MSLFQRYQAELDDLQRNGNLRSFPSLTEKTTLVNLSGNDYLGLASDKFLRQEFLETALNQDWQMGSTSSRLLAGNADIYEKLEDLLAYQYGAEAALIFNSGYHANIGILPALTNNKSLILADKLVHASLIDGIKLSGATFFRYRHNDLTHLTTLLDKYANEYESVFIVTESVFSMDGDVAPLLELCRLKQAYSNSILYVDEAHAVGVRGSFGLGLAEELGCLKEIDILVGTFGKAYASMGAFVVTNKLIRNYLINKARPLIFSTALPPLCIAWIKFITEKMSSFDKQRQHLKEISRYLSSVLGEAGIETFSESHILPIIIGDSQETVILANYLKNEGFAVSAIRPPTVKSGSARIRLSLSAGINFEDLDKLSRVLKKIRQ